MGDPNPMNNVGPYHDDDTNMILNFDPTLLDSSNNIFPEVGDDAAVQALLDDIAPFLDPMFPSDHKFEAGPSSQFHTHDLPPLPEQLPHPHQQNYNDNNNNHNVVATSLLCPNLPVPFSCTFCQTLREIVYTDGVLHFSKLQIHGKLGLISHAVLYQNNDVGSSAHQPFQIFDFSQKSIPQIKIFLIRHCLNQNSMGYFMMRDPLSLYYESLACGLDWAEDSHNDKLSDHGPDGAGTSGVKFGMEQHVNAENDMERTPTSGMKLSDMRNLFDLPIEKAAKKLKLCPTEMKKICRKHGLERWPQRKVKSIGRQISILRRALESGDGASTRSQTEAEIERLEQEMARHCGGFPPTSLNQEPK